MEEVPFETEVVKLFVETSLIRNKKLILIYCEGAQIPNSAASRTIEFGNFELTTYVRTNNDPILVQGDIVVLQNRQDGQSN